VDLLDFAIYRYLSPRGEARFWAGRRLIDPTIPAQEIAQKVGISENGVRARLRGLAKKGYLRHTMVLLNPSLFGAQVFVAELPVRKVSEVDKIFRDLALVEGVIFARDTLDERDRQIRVHFVSEDETTALRRATLLRRLSPTDQLRGPLPYWIPPCERELSPLDWRVLQAVWTHPARALRMSLKTTSKKHHQLVESHACWWTHGSDSEEFPLALLQVEVGDPGDWSDVAERVQREATAWMPVASDGLGFEPETVQTVVAGLVPADVPTGLEKLVRKCVALPGVINVRRTFPLGSANYSAWFADRLRDRVAARS
jgi:DNA-binding Lrp family transcriptional regulator